MIYQPYKDIPVLPAQSLCVVTTQDDTTITASIDGETVTLATFSKKGAYVIPIPSVDKIKANKPVSVTQGTFSLGSSMVGGDGGAKVDALRYKGSVASVGALPSSAAVGDMYNVEEDGNNYAWTGTAWDSLGPVIIVEDTPRLGSQNPISSGWAFIEFNSVVDRTNYLKSQMATLVDSRLPSIETSCVDYKSFVDSYSPSVKSFVDFYYNPVISHLNNDTIHITAAERERWDDSVRRDEIYDHTVADFRTIKGSEDKGTNKVTLDACRVPAGLLRIISIPCAVSAEWGGSTSSPPLYLAIWEMAENGQYLYIGRSTNAVQQVANTTSSWVFDNLPLSGRGIFIKAYESTNIQPAGGVYIGARVADGSITENSKVSDDSDGMFKVADVKFRMIDAEFPKFAAKIDLDNLRLSLVDEFTNGGDCSPNDLYISCVDYANNRDNILISCVDYRTLVDSLVDSIADYGHRHYSIRDALFSCVDLLDLLGDGGYTVRDVVSCIDTVRDVASRVDGVGTSVDYNHVGNTTIHITAEERTKWNSNSIPEDQRAYLNKLVNNTSPPTSTGTLIVDSDLYSHVGDMLPHITPDERTRWDEWESQWRVSMVDMYNGINPYRAAEWNEYSFRDTLKTKKDFGSLAGVTNDESISADITDFAQRYFTDSHPILTREIWFETGDPVCEITWPAVLIWTSGEAPTLKANTAYRFVIRLEENNNGLANDGNALRAIASLLYSYPLPQT